MKRLPAMVAALLALALTATAVFAAAAPSTGTLPSPAASAQAAHPGGGEILDAHAGGTETDEATETAETNAQDSPHPSNHGGDVSAAAQASTPAGCTNHGEYVSLVARGQWTGTCPVTAPAAHPSGPPAEVPPAWSHSQAGKHGKGQGPKQ